MTNTNFLISISILFFSCMGQHKDNREYVLNTGFDISPNDSIILLLLYKFSLWILKTIVTINDKNALLVEKPCGINVHGKHNIQCHAIGMVAITKTTDTYQKIN